MLQKFKEWLIIKLGGRLQPPPVFGKVVNIQPVDAHKTVTMDSRYDSNPILYADIRDRAVLSTVYQIAERLYHDGYFEITEDHDDNMEATSIGLTLWVMPPNWRQR